MLRKGGFTLIELLVVIAIIAILAAILFPVFARARAKAQENTCLSNCKQMALAAVMYVTDYDNVVFVDSYTTGGVAYWWPTLLFPYVKNNQIFLCPTDSNQRSEDPNGNATAPNTPPQVSYCMNGTTTSNWGTCSSSMTGYGYNCPTLEAVDDTARTILFYDYNDYKTGSRVEGGNYQAYQLDFPVPGIAAGSQATEGSPSASGTSYVGSRHFGGYNTSYMDGHAKWVLWGSTNTLNWAIHYIPGGGC